MGTLAFFPWLPGQDLVENSAFALLPFEPNKSPCKSGSVEQDHIDRVLGAYHTSAIAPLKTGTVLTLPNHGITDDLDDEDVAEIFLLSEVIAMSALAIREFFQNDYFNRDNYRLVVQNFQPDRHSVALVARRRDGSSMSAWLDGSYMVIRPAHVPLLHSWQLDEELLVALLASRSSPHWDRLHDAIKYYNRANTDSSDVDMADEAVMLIAAFQRVLNCSGAKVDELATKLLPRAQPSDPVAFTNCGRTSANPDVNKKFANSSSVTHAWIQDFYALRGNVAHGKPDTSYPSVWSLREHLLLGSFLFPRLLKNELLVLGYTIDATGVQADIDTFEALACQRHFADFETGDYPWAKTRSPIKLAIRKIWAKLGL